MDESLLRIIITAIGYVLRYNFFECNSNVLYQRKGLAMGTPLAPPVANLFLASYEARLMRVVAPPLLYVRFLDDIFVVQKSSETEPLLWAALTPCIPTSSSLEKAHRRWLTFSTCKSIGMGRDCLPECTKRTQQVSLHRPPGHVILGM